MQASSSFHALNVTTGTRSEWLPNALNPDEDDRTPRNISDSSSTSQRVAKAAESNIGPVQHRVKRPGATNEWPLPPFDTFPSQVLSRKGPVEINVSLDSEITLTGEDITGRLTVRCKRENGIKFGDIYIYLSGYEGYIFITLI
jgi:hypothetical protein